PISITVSFKYSRKFLVMYPKIHGLFEISHDSRYSLPVHITRSAGKSAQQSHDICNVGSSTVSDISKAANDARILNLSNTFTGVLK
ncbi:hypothetical protein A2U01_0030225, partial [Trifolium medium]|nr:hypothetical protein [Trifolium medium]